MVLDEAGKTVLLMGNEAIVRGALEAGVQVAATYPGTPASEIGDTFARIQNQTGIYMEYAVNEKVALETALTGAWCGLRSLVSMKHVGVNVAADALMSLAYAGVEGGFILVVGDDPSCHSSQNEQDSRYYALLAGMPCLEPASPQEAKDMIPAGFALSEKFKTPVMVRLTTRTAHARGDVKLGPLNLEKKEGAFVPDRKTRALLPANACRIHPLLLEKMAALARELGDFPFNTMQINGRRGIIACGASYNYVREALDILGYEDISLLKIASTWPLPETRIIEFIKYVDELLVAEELEPITEREVCRLAVREGLSVSVHGKDMVPGYHELSTNRVASAIHRLWPREAFDEAFPPQAVEVPPLAVRSPVLCPGCPHRATFFAIRKVVKDGILPGDIGCYTLGIQPPLEGVDTCVCMGASVGLASAFSHFQKKKVLATIGDSTFIHSGLSPLVNALYTGADIALVIMDNRTTAMTGFQPNPSSGLDSAGRAMEPFLPERIAEGMGVRLVRVVDPFDLKATQEAIEEAVKFEGVAVVVSRRPCQLLKYPGKKAMAPYHTNTEKCVGCRICIEKLGCPAISFDKEGNKSRVDDLLCAGCGYCVQVCPKKAFETTATREAVSSL
jgi:indolepyruvate ferredoxin oxidoreductase alpha subunit